MTPTPSASNTTLLERDRRTGPSPTEVAAYVRAASKRRGLTAGELAEVMAERFALAPSAPAPVRPFLEAIVDTFVDANHEIHIDCDPSLQAPLAELVPTATAACEAISNALRHAFPEGRDGRIWVKFAQDGERRALLVRDNGIGLPDLAPNPLSGRGLLDALARQLGGYARLGSAPFGGALVSVVYPRAPSAA
jgi:signal transduction histidine kinase